MIRNEEDIRKGIEKITEISNRATNISVPNDRTLNTAWHATLALKSLLTVSLALAKAALERKESRGAHTRDDFPNYDKELGSQNIILRKDGSEMLIRKEPLPVMPERLQIILNNLDREKDN